MAGKPTPRGNWGDWAIIEYLKKPRSEEGEFYKNSKAAPSTLGDSIKTLNEDEHWESECKYSVRKSGVFLCKNGKSALFNKECKKCSLLKIETIRIGNKTIKHSQMTKNCGRYLKGKKKNQINDINKEKKDVCNSDISNKIRQKRKMSQSDVNEWRKIATVLMENSDGLDRDISSKVNEIELSNPKAD